MKKEIRRISNLFRTEMKFLSVLLSSLKRDNAATLVFLSFILFFTGRGITEAHLSMPFLRGGYTAYSAPATKSLRINRQLVIPTKINRLTNLKEAWTKLKSGFQTKQSQGTHDLEDVLSAFKTVLNGNDIDTSQLLKACRAHLKLMRSGGASLRLVAKDLESNLLKAEKPFNQSRKQGKTLYSLLESERKSGMHNGNELENESAAMVSVLVTILHCVFKRQNIITYPSNSLPYHASYFHHTQGLLWIRRSLAFQMDLFESSLVPQNGKHPGDAALDAYATHLSAYHGWMLQKIFPLSLSAMPNRSAFIAAFGGSDDPLDPAQDEEIVRQLKTLLATLRPIIKRWSDDFKALNLEDTRPA